MNDQELFDEQTIQKLTQHGIVINYNKHNLYNCENQFHIIDTHNFLLMKAIKWSLIKLNIKRAYYTLSKSFNYNEYGYTSETHNLREAVFYSYPRMFQYVDHLKTGNTLWLVPNAQDMRKGNCFKDCVYDSNIHGFKPFGLINPRLNNQLYFSGKIIIPTKKVTVPPPSHQYE